MAFSWRLDPIVLPPRTLGSPGAAPGGDTSSSAAGATEPGIKEDIDPKFRERYEKWKAEFLSTAAGRSDWERFANDPAFTLTIRMSEAEEKAVPPRLRDDARKGGHVVVEAYRWDSNDRLVAATIFLGSGFDKGDTDEGDYPILSAAHLRGDDLAAAKIAHEFGHVKRTASLPPDDLHTYRKALALSAQADQVYRQTKDRNDPTFLQLASEAERAAGSKRDREHRAEANVIPFLVDKYGERMPRETQDAIATYRKQHPGRY